MKNRIEGILEPLRAIYQFVGIITYPRQRKRILGGIAAAFLCLLFCTGAIFADDYLILDQGYPAPFTGVLMNLDYLQKMTRVIQEKERLEVENRILIQRINIIKEDCHNALKQQRALYWKTGVAFVLGTGLAILTMYVIQQGGNGVGKSLDLDYRGHRRSFVVFPLGTLVFR